MNNNPSPQTRFKKGKSGNPGGKSKEQKRVEMRNAERAMLLRGKYLAALERRLDKAMELGEDEAMTAAIAQIDQANLKLIKDAEDRGLGAPVQPASSPDEAMRPTIIKLVAG